MAGMEPSQVLSYDGRTIVPADPRKPTIELGHLLGGGSAGVVYEARLTSPGGASWLSRRVAVAVKVLHPLAYRPEPHPHRFTRIVRPLGDSSAELREDPVTRERIIVRAAPGEGIVELALPASLELFGHLDRAHESGATGEHVERPRKLARLLRRRERVLRETKCMRLVSGHRNLLELEDVLELVDDWKVTIVLVMELARGGELFDQIRPDEGMPETAARHYFRQLLSGIQHCHSRGVCHRDVKPENLLLSEDGVLKIADFGLSAASGDDVDDSQSIASGDESHDEEEYVDNDDEKYFKSPPRRRARDDQNSFIVGTPHYAAPEVVLASTTGCSHRYDAYKADAWSAGVVLYALLAGRLPFGRDLRTCHRFAAWRRLSSMLNARPDEAIEAPTAASFIAEDPGFNFFPDTISNEAAALVAGLLDPDPRSRLDVGQASDDVWFASLGAVVTGARVVTSSPIPIVPAPAKARARGGGSGGATSREGSYKLSFQSPPLAPLRPDDEEGGDHDADGDNDDDLFAPPALDLAAPAPSTSGFGGSVAASSRRRAPAIFVSSVRRSTRLTTRAPPSEIVRLLAECAIERGLDCDGNDDDDPFRVRLRVDRGIDEVLEPFAVVQIFLARNGVSDGISVASTGASYVVELTRASGTSIFECKRLFSLLRERLAPVAARFD